jgi:hypothetical protein
MPRAFATGIVKALTLTDGVGYGKLFVTCAVWIPLRWMWRICDIRSGRSSQLLLKADVASLASMLPRLPGARSLPPIACTMHLALEHAVRHQRVPAGRIAPSALRLGLALILALFVGGRAAAQLRESFESPTATWTLAQADCGVKKLLQERTFRESHAGSGCERLRLQIGNGTFVYITHPIGKAPVIAELAPSLWVKADKANVQLLARVVYPRTTDPGTGRSISSLLAGDRYTDVGAWQQLKIADLQKLVERDAAARRLEFKEKFSEREAYIDLLVLNAYAGPGTIDVSIDDLEIEGYLNLGEDIDVVRPDRQGGDGLPAGADPRQGVAMQGSLLLVDGRPLMPRLIEHQGEPLEWLKSLGFNGVKLSKSPTADELKEAARLKLWLVAPPPYAAGEQRLGSEYDPVLAWSLGSDLAGRDLEPTRQVAGEIRAFDPRQQRPLVCGAVADLANYSRLADAIYLSQPTLGTSFELGALRGWLTDRSRLVRPGTPLWAGVQTHLPAALREQIVQMSQGGAWNEDLDLAQMRLLVYSSLAAGAKGLVFQSQLPLHTESNAGAFRVDLLKLLNYELLLLEPWGAAGDRAEPIDTGDPSLQASVLATERSRLVLITRHMPAQQFVAGPPDTRPISIVVPGVPISDVAYQITLAGPKELRTKTTSGGLRVTIDEPDLAMAVVVTQDPLVLHHLKRILDEARFPIAQLRYEASYRRLLAVTDIDRELTEAGHGLAAAAAWIAEAQGYLQQARRAHSAGSGAPPTSDLRTLHAACGKCDAALAKVRRSHWEQTAAAFPSPASSPCIARFGTLPIHWKFAQRLQRNNWGPNALAAGDMESLNQLLGAGWKQQREVPPGVHADVALSLASPHGGRTALKMHAWAESADKAPASLERAPLWITSSPVPVRQGQLVRIHGWVQVPRPLAACREGLLIFDSMTGPAMGERVFATSGWRAFTLYRAVPENGELRVTIALTGLGEASLDDLSVSLIGADPIRETKAATGDSPR